MNRLPIIAFSVSVLASAPALRADTATITVTGHVLPGTCTLPADLPVALDEISTDALKAGHDNGLKPTTLAFSGCMGVSTIDLAFDGVADAAQDGHWSNTASTGQTATGVAVVLLHGNSGNDFLKKGDTRTIPVRGASANVPLRVGYFAKVPTAATAGAVASMITVTAVYK